jgi:hypothetical protein
MLTDDFVPFLLRAKKATYASGVAPSQTSRPSSHDLQYNEGPCLYIDTYLGGIQFIGEEAVWKDNVNIWGMNYYGKLLVEQAPEGFNQFLRSAMLQVPAEAPFRGPVEFASGDFIYLCSSEGALDFFNGQEDIYYLGEHVYRLLFHGGEIEN